MTDNPILGAFMGNTPQQQGLHPKGQYQPPAGEAYPFMSDTEKGRAMRDKRYHSHDFMQPNCGPLNPHYDQEYFDHVQARIAATVKMKAQPKPMSPQSQEAIARLKQASQQE